MTGECPECDANVPLDAQTVVGEVIPCPECSADLEVTALQPAVLVMAPPEEEDWGE
jgi:alpha-aminoadipate/glutamate carrier protein LysW